MAFLITACSHTNPIVFQKKSDISEVTLTLDTNGTFPDTFDNFCWYSCQKKHPR